MPRSRYCVVHKADIRNYRLHAVALYVRFHSRHNRLKGDRCHPCRIWDAGKPIPHLENYENVEPSAQFSDGDASDRLSRGDPGAGAKSRCRQEPCPDFFRHLQRLPQGCAGSPQDRAGRILAGLSAPALHHLERDGLAAQRLSDCQRSDRYPRFQARPAGEGCETRSPRAARPIRSPDPPGAAPGGRQARS